QAIAGVEAGLGGGSLSGEQRHSVEAICTSGRGAELVVGVAGAGKTTMLRAVHGPEVVCPGGRAYRAGDQVVTLAPGPGGSLVTSERATVEAADPSAAALVLRTHDGRAITLTGAEASA